MSLGTDAVADLVTLWERSVARHGGRRFLGTRGADGRFRWASYREVDRRIADVRAGLARRGVAAGTTVAFIGGNRVEWVVAAFATYGLGGVFVPLYEAELPATVRDILRDSGARVAFVATRARARTLEEMRPGLPALTHVVVLEGGGDGSLEGLEHEGRRAPVPACRPAADDVAALIYTSGTAGAPKGVLLTHRNFVSTVYAGQAVFPELCETSGALSVLPWAHVYAQTGELYNFIDLGGSIGIAGGPTTVAADLRAVRPTHLIAVPRVFNRVHEVIWRTLREEGGLKLRLFEAALAAARARRETGRTTLRYVLLDRLVLAKVRARFGGRFQGALTSSARSNPEISQFYFDVGLPVYDCYGMTETSPAVTMNGPRGWKLGTVGRPVPGVRVVIDRTMVDDGSDDGEIIVHGPNVMRGYHGKPEATAAALQPDGGLRTGDRGRLDQDGYLILTGRFKEQYKLENGKYVFPAAIEDELQLLPYVANAMVQGEDRQFNVCLVALDLAALERHASALGLPATWRDLLLGDPSQERHPGDGQAWRAGEGKARRASQGHGRAGEGKARRAVEDLIARALSAHLQGKFAGYEIPKAFVFTSKPFSVENELLTQTLKVRRRAVLAAYLTEIEAAHARAMATAAER